MNAPWTALGTPAIAVPLPVSGGLPLGLQLPAARGNGTRVLGRVGFTAETITGADGKFAPELLALHLFRKPHARG